jgi:hypothetical protein
MTITFQNITITGGFSVDPIAAPVVPTDPYWANVSFLSETVSTNGKQNFTYLDGSSINATISTAGASSASLTQGSFSPYPANNTTSYSAATNGGSGFFPGSAAYLSAPSNAAYVLGTGDFTIDCWVNFNSTSGAQIFCYSGDLGSRISDLWGFGYTGGTLYFGIPAGGFSYASTPFTPSLNTWYYVSVTRASGIIRMFINGVSGTVTGSSFADSLSCRNNFSVGAGRYNDSGTYYMNGYLSDVRLVKGTALYTSSFSPPTAPLTAVSGTSLLLNYTNAGLYDARAKSDLISIGSAQASTTQAKWAPTSAYFNGSSSSLYAPSNTAFAFGTGDFTVEGWVNFASLSPGGSGAIVPFCQSDAIGSSTNDKWWFGYTASTLRFATHSSGGFSCSTPFNPSTSTWYYVTATRASGTVRLFVNGVSGTVTTSGTPSGYSLSQNGLSVGGFSTPAYLNGYIQDLRLTKGVARYTATFTPPTAALPTAG